MTIELTHQEVEYLMELLHNAHTEKLHELHHTDTVDYKEMLKRKIELLEALAAKLKRMPME